MEKKEEPAKSVDEYISRFPPTVRARLDALRAAILKAAPDASERISYGMPAFELAGPLLYFAAFERHIGLYALPSAMIEFKDRLGGYKSGKGSVRFPLDEEMPYALIGDIVRFRVRENERKAAEKKPRHT